MGRGGGGAVKTVLVADDEPVIRQLLAELLTEAGYAVRAARDGAEALALLADQTPDLVLTDVMMPRLNGPELVRQMRRRPGSAAVPAILMSAVAVEPDGLEADFLAKPFDLDRLLAAVRRALGESPAGG